MKVKSSNSKIFSTPFLISIFAIFFVLFFLAGTVLANIWESGPGCPVFCKLTYSLSSWTNPGHETTYTAGGFIRFTSSYTITVAADVTQVHVYGKYLRLSDSGCGIGGTIELWRNVGSKGAGPASYNESINQNVQIPLAFGASNNACALVRWHFDYKTSGGVTTWQEKWWGEHVNVNPPCSDAPGCPGQGCSGNTPWTCQLMGDGCWDKVFGAACPANSFYCGADGDRWQTNTGCSGGSCFNNPDTEVQDCGTNTLYCGADGDRWQTNDGCAGGSCFNNPNTEVQDCGTNTSYCLGGDLCWTNEGCAGGACFNNPDTCNPDPSCAPSLSVTLDANPSSGSHPLNDVDLTADVSGTASGTINYTFYCDRSDADTNITLGWAAKFDSVLEDPKTAIDVCDYPTPGTYIAKVIAERESLAAEDRETITVTNNPPVVTLNPPLMSAPCPPDSVAVLFPWTADDPEDDTISQWFFQVDEAPADWLNLAVDKSGGPVSDPYAGDQLIAVDGDLKFGGKRYDWRVKAIDEHGKDSLWVYGQRTDPTPTNPPPDPSFKCSLDQTAPEADWKSVCGEDELGAIIDETIWFKNFNPKTGPAYNTYQWEFIDPDTGLMETKFGQKVDYAFPEDKDYTVTHTVTDDGTSCSLSKPVNISEQLPEWREIPPT